MFFRLNLQIVGGFQLPHFVNLVNLDLLITNCNCEVDSYSGPYLDFIVSLIFCFFQSVELTDSTPYFCIQVCLDFSTIKSQSVCSRTFCLIMSLCELCLTPQFLKQVSSDFFLNSSHCNTCFTPYLCKQVSSRFNFAFKRFSGFEYRLFNVFLCLQYGQDKSVM